MSMPKLQPNKCICGPGAVERGSVLVAAAAGGASGSSISIAVAAVVLVMLILVVVMVIAGSADIGVDFWW